MDKQMPPDWQEENNAKVRKLLGLDSDAERMAEHARQNVEYDDAIDRIARVCHEVNRAYCAALGDRSQLPWDEAPEWQKASARKGVEFIIDNPDAGPESSHESWLLQKASEGWGYGPVKDEFKKEHPCYVPYDKLPVEQKAKDYIFGAIVRSMM